LNGKKRNGVNDLKKENIGYENGVLGGVISALNIFCSRGEKILVILLYILVIKKFSKTMAII
jgi:hypothetical protein